LNSKRAFRNRKYLIERYSFQVCPYFVKVFSLPVGYIPNFLSNADQTRMSRYLAPGRVFFAVFNLKNAVAGKFSKNLSFFICNIY